MVSTRGIKLKFSENERVLCYEPDPTKAKVLYDSKVLDVVVTKDPRGRKTVEYLIHFQGWNSSWDRYVSEEYVLKDTPENRQLQKDLAEKSQLQLGAYLYRRDRKKHNRKSGDRAAPSSDDGSSCSPARMDTDDAHGETSTSEDDSSLDEEQFQIELPPELKQVLEQDFCLINTKNKLVKLPAEPNIVSILESYWKHYATGQICDFSEKPNARNRWPFGNNTQGKRRPEDIQRNLSVCSEILDGIRLYFDFTVNDLLLYKAEQGQVVTGQATYQIPMFINKEDTSKNDVSYMDYITYPSNFNEEDYQNERAMSRKRSLRSNKSVDCISNGNSHPENAAKTKASSSEGGVMEVTKPMSWRLLPEHVYIQQPPPPCLMYGAIHLTRLFVKLPELISASCIDDNKWKILLHHIDSFIDYLNDHREWFGERFYVEK